MHFVRSGLNNKIELQAVLPLLENYRVRGVSLFCCCIRARSAGMISSSSHAQLVNFEMTGSIQYRKPESSGGGCVCFGQFLRSCCCCGSWAGASMLPEV